MPRIYTSASDPIDFCRRCFRELFPTEENARKVYGNVGDGPDNRGDCFGYDAEHPAYGGEGYECEYCRTRLTDKDNGEGA